MTLTKRLARILKDINEVTNALEERGFETQVAALDAAGGKIEDVKNDFDGL